MLIYESALCNVGFFFQNRIYETGWDSESEEPGALSDCIIYLGNGIFCTFRQPLKYLRFSYSFLDDITKYVDSIPPRKICCK